MSGFGKRIRRTQHTGLRTVSGIASQFDVARTTVVRAINDGRLPAYTADGDGGVLFLVKPADAEALWGLRAQPLSHDPELIFA